MTKSLENKITNAVHSIEPSSEFSEKLWNEIKNTPCQAPSSRRIPRRRWVPAIAIIALAIILIVISPQSVMACFRGLFDFLPGIGLVQKDESTQYLAEPIIVEQDGVTLTIEQVVADGNKTTVSYRIDGLPVGDSNSNTSCFYNNNRLLLSDGTSLLPIGGGVKSDQASNEALIEFMPLPEDVSQATLLASMNSEEFSCSAPQEWEVDFSLGTTKPSDMELLPVVDNPAESTTDSDVHLIFEKTVALEDGYILYGHIEWTDENWENVSVHTQTLSALDAEGKEIPLDQSIEGSHDNEFVFKIASKDFAAPLTLYVQNLWISAHFEDTVAFSFDAGSDPQIGQSWDLNQEVEIEGYKITIQTIRAIQESAEMVQGDPKEGYAIEVGNTKNFDGFIVCEGQGEGSADWSQGMPIDDTSKVFETYYSGGLPYGSVNCSFLNAHFLLSGTWEIEWQPPLAEE